MSAITEAIHLALVDIAMLCKSISFQKFIIIVKKEEGFYNKLKGWNFKSRD